MLIAELRRKKIALLPSERNQLRLTINGHVECQMLESEISCLVLNFRSELFVHGKLTQ